MGVYLFQNVDTPQEKRGPLSVRYFSSHKKVAASEKRRYQCNVFSHSLKIFKVTWTSRKKTQPWLNQWHKPCNNSIANALELLHSCTKPSKCLFLPCTNAFIGDKGMKPKASGRLLFIISMWPVRIPCTHQWKSRWCMWLGGLGAQCCHKTQWDAAGTFHWIIPHHQFECAGNLLDSYPNSDEAITTFFKQMTRRGMCNNLQRYCCHD